ncbi:Trophinin [Halotydeus destructor]|nr:Trophinin [Halotydeus destructor]
MPRYVEESSGDSSSEEEAGQRRRPQRANASQLSFNQDDDGLKENERYVLQDIINYVMVASKNGMPVKRADITANACKRGGLKLNARLLSKVAEIMLNEHKLKFLETDKKGNDIKYILVHADPSRETPFTQQAFTEADTLKRGILLGILAVLFMSGGSAETATVFRFLRRCGLDTETSDYIDGLELTTKELIHLFNKQMYIETSKETVGDVDVQRIKWGFRAHHEVKKEDILQMVSEIYGVEKTVWRAQYQEVLLEANDLMEAS